MSSEKGKAKQVKQITGVVVSRSGAKTVVVKTTVFKVHRKYHKRYTATRKYFAHDERNEYRVGDKAVIVPSRPNSRRKRFMVLSK